MLWYCVVSSLIFTTNSLAAYLYNQYIVSLLWLGLTITSILYHTERIHSYYGTYIFTDTLIEHNKTNTHMQIVYVFDTIMTWMVIGTVLALHYTKMMKIRWSTYVIFINIGMFLLLGYVSFVYLYGREIKDYCFHPYSEVAEQFHMTLHIAASLSHHLSMGI